METNLQTKEHWQSVYSSKATNAVSWFQERAVVSLQLIHETGVAPDAAVIDVGGGASVLVDDLLAGGFVNLSVLDISAAALRAAQDRLGPERAQMVRWIKADITQADLPAKSYDVWHDRAVFHFLTRPEDRAAYVRLVSRAVKPGGHVIVATFAEDGPTQCSGLPVMRYGAEQLHGEFGPAFTLLEHRKEVHRTPFGTDQRFVYCYCRTAFNDPLPTKDIPMTDAAEPKPSPPMVDAQTLRNLSASDPSVVVVDVRSAAEFGAGTVPGAIHLPADQLGALAGKLSKDATIVTVCNHGGSRSCGAAEQLRAMGFENAAALKGGVHGFDSN